MQRALPELEHFDEVIGAHVAYVPDIALHQVGYLFLLTHTEDVETFRRAVALQRSLGVETETLTASEALRLVPGLAVDDVLAATFCPREGHCSPEAVVQGYAAAAASLGVRIHQGRPATGITHAAGRIAAVETPSGPVATATVVCAAGAWSAEVGALAGVEIPVRAAKRWMWFSPESGDLPDRMPLTVDFTTSFYAHREGPGLVFGGKEDTLEAVAEHGLRRLPVLGDLPVTRRWWGLYEDSPDHNAIVGELDAPSRFLLATGFSGHGFQQAPAIGEHLAELVTGRPPTLDLRAFAPDRFARGALRPEAFVV